MPLKIAIVADDLTGAIDTATPFAQRGMKVAVALTGDHLEQALAEDPAVLTVATGTRHMSDADARARLLHITQLLRRLSPDIYFKKVDSRLKGNVVAETLAMLDGLERHRIVLAPAIPEQGRLLQAGHITGMGVARPIALPVFPAHVEVHAPDIVGQDDLMQVAMRILQNPDALAVGARGLGQALAGQLSMGSDNSLPPVFEFPLLIAIGSRDPITVRQVEHLTGARNDVAIEHAPNGYVPALEAPHSAVTLIRCIEVEPAEDSEAVAQRFGNGVAALMRRHMPRTLIASGGDTAAAILLSASVDTIRPLGEIEAGLPISSFTLDGAQVHLITKSGGFGHDGIMREVIENARASSAIGCDRHPAAYAPQNCSPK